MSDGFQFLEQRDAENNVTNKGIVSKDSMLTSAANDGIYDVIAEDLRVLKGLVDDFQPDISAEDVAAIKRISEQVNKSYVDATKLQSAVRADALRAQEAADDAKTYRDDVVRVANLSDRV